MIRDADDTAAVLCETLVWAEEPPWPDHVCAVDQRLPFLSSWHCTPRMHHLIARTSTWDYSAEESRAIDDFLAMDMGVSRRDWPKLAESLHLVVPNPYFRHLDETLTRIGEREAVSVVAEMRRGVVAPSLEVDITDHRPTGIGGSARVSLGATAIDVPLGVTLQETSVIVRDAGGILYVRPRAPFLRHFALNLDIVSSRRTVDVFDRGAGTDTSFDVDVTSPMVTHIGTAPELDGASALHRQLTDLEIRSMAHDLEQHWFAGDRKAARTIVQGLVASARTGVLVADPYLAMAEIQYFGLAVRLAGVPVRLLTTRDGIEKGGMHPTVLAENLRRWALQVPNLGAIELRVMGESVLHDRFLRVDERLYTLGNSLNSIGDKASLMLRVPDPRPVFSELEKIWKGAEPIVDVAKNWKRG